MDHRNNTFIAGSRLEFVICGDALEEEVCFISWFSGINDSAKAKSIQACYRCILRKFDFDRAMPLT